MLLDVTNREKLLNPYFLNYATTRRDEADIPRDEVLSSACGQTLFLTRTLERPIVRLFGHSCLNEAVSHAEWLRVTGPSKPRQPDQETA